MGSGIEQVFNYKNLFLCIVITMGHAFMPTLNYDPHAAIIKICIKKTTFYRNDNDMVVKKMLSV